MKLISRSMLAAVAGGLIALLTPLRGTAIETARALDLRAVFPAPGATNVPPDTLLRIALSATPKLGAGEIRIFDASDDRLVEAVDVSQPVGTKTIGGLSDYRYHRVLPMEREVIVALELGALKYGKKYCVTVDAGALADEAGPVGGVNRARGWSFSTQAAPPAHDAGATLTVAANGTADFCTLQGALDSIPEGNTTPKTILLRAGVYPEIVFVTDKHALTITGEDRKRTVIAYPNNARFNASGGNPFAGKAPDPGAQSVRQGGSIYRRGMILAHRVNDLTIANLTLRNTTPQGGSQAEALILNGTTEARAVLRDVDLYSFQDTLQINGQAFVTNCYIEGDVDFMWGTGPVFFEKCVARSVRSKAYYTQIRNPATNRGYVYVGCTFDGAPGVTDNYLSRIEPARFPHSEVVLIDCVLGPSVNAPAWRLDPYPKEAPIPPIPDVHFWEFNSRDANGQPIDASGRMPGSRQLTLPEDAELVAKYRDPAFVLGGWNPRR